MRSRLIGCRTQASNQIRGLLAEYGIVLPQNLAQVRQALPILMDDSETRLSSCAKELFASMYEELCALDERITSLETKLKQVFLSNPLCQRISAIEGIGPVTATAVVAAISDGSAFHMMGFVIASSALLALKPIIVRRYSSSFPSFLRILSPFWEGFQSLMIFGCSP
jgi:transposase